VKRGKTQVALGVIVSSKGQILTKLSQIESSNGGAAQLASTSGSESAARLKCQMPGGRVLDATILATDPNTDLALLKVEPTEGLKTANWSRDFDPRLGIEGHGDEPDRERGREGCDDEGAHALDFSKRPAIAQKTRGRLLYLRPRE
jgi:hypothetical protein